MMKRFLILIVLVSLGGRLLAAETSNAPVTPPTADADAIPVEPPPPAGWTVDLPKAIERAKAEHKKVLIDFTGSDWCPNCQELKTNVFEKPEFAAYASTNFVLVFLDFPIFHKVPEPLSLNNANLAKKYAVEGWPTILILDGDGKEVHRTVGLPHPTVKNFIEEINSPAKPPMKSSVFGGALVLVVLLSSFLGWLVSRRSARRLVNA